MKKQEDGKLAGLFRKMPLDDLSEGFESTLMQKIEACATENSRKKKLYGQTRIVLAIVAGISAIIGLPAIVFFVIGFSFDYQRIMSSFALDFSFDANPLFVLIAATVLMLVVLDTLIRRHIQNRHKH